MKTTHIPCYFYPTKTILVDDNPAFLKTLDFALGHQFKCTSFEDPKETLKYIIKQTKQFSPLIKKYVVSDNISEKSVTINLPTVHREIYNKNRFEEISVIVVDYAMPNMTGMELCHQIRELIKFPIKLIMLTGEADLPIAVQAFNEGIIDKFILKSKGDYIKEVIEAISILQEKYFYNLSEPIRIALQPSAQKLLRKQSLIDIFNKIIQGYDFKEFYIIEDSLSTLFIDEQGENSTCLIIKTESEMETIDDIAIHDRGVSAEIINELEKRKKITFFPDKKSLAKPGESWIFYQAKPIGKNCYYAIEKNIYPLKKKLIFSYQKYLENDS